MAAMADGLRQLAMRRKGAIPASAGSDTGTDDGDGPDTEGSDDADGVECPNCKCQFDPATETVTKPGFPVVGGEGEGMDLDTSGSAQPEPGPMGAAADASRGESVMGDLLANLRGGMRR